MTKTRIISTSILMLSSTIFLITIKYAGAQDKAAAPVAKSPSFTQPNIKNTFADWMTARPIAEHIKIRKTDPLLRPPFAEQPVDSVKGLAAKIRAEELDTCNRVRAVRYLGTVDCKAYPEAQDQLIDALHNDKYEVVRYEAALALQVMLCGCGDPNHCNLTTDPNFKGDKCSCKDKQKKVYPNTKNIHFLSGRDACGGCCNKDVLNALAKTAYERDEKDPRCCFEPSARVRHAARDAIMCCNVCCRQHVCDMYPAPVDDMKKDDKDDIKKDDTKKDDKKGEVNPKGGNEQTEPKKTEESKEKTPMVIPQPDPKTSVYMPRAIPEEAPLNNGEISGIKGFCVVELKNKKFVASKSEFWSVYNTNIYFFSSAEAKQKFDSTPEDYAIKFGGRDVVKYCESGEIVEGKFLHLHRDGHFYLFTSRENRELFRQDADHFLSESQKDIQPKAASTEDITLVLPEMPDVQQINADSKVMEPVVNANQQEDFILVLDDVDTDGEAAKPEISLNEPELKQPEKTADELTQEMLEKAKPVAAEKPAQPGVIRIRNNLKK